LTKVFDKLALKLPKKIIDVFEPLRSKLITSGINKNFETYVGILTACSAFLGLISFIVLELGLYYSYSLTWRGYIYSAIISVIIFLVTILVGYSIPYIMADNRGRIIDATLPNIANFMSILATTGMTTGNIISSLGRVSERFNVKKEMDLMITDIEILGYDVHKAIRHAYDVSSSRDFANLLFGVVSTSQMGGDLASYLKNQAEKNTNKRLLSMRGFIDTLAIIAEGYITIMVVGPLMLLVMLTVMSFIGGGNMMGDLSVEFIMSFLTFIFIPVGIMVLILAIDATSPIG
jgi:flagellar protein FlaJ